ncbi:hypothetical protein FQR65_LT02720 [Abscondita terminalis]|nr:hypothetical protein FQR65_LT02720 [Abscondita terminalis]
MHSAYTNRAVSAAIAIQATGTVCGQPQRTASKMFVFINCGQPDDWPHYRHSHSPYDDIIMKRGEVAKCSSNIKREQSDKKTRKVGVDNRGTVRSLVRKNTSPKVETSVDVIKSIVNEIVEDAMMLHTSAVQSKMRDNIDEKKNLYRKTRVFIDSDSIDEDPHKYLERKASLYSLEEHDEDHEEMVDIRKRNNERSKSECDHNKQKNSKVSLGGVFRRKSKKEEEVAVQKECVSNDDKAEKHSRLSRTPSFRKKLSNFINKDAPGFLRRSFSFKDISKNREKEKSRDKLAAMKNSEWASSLQSLVETDIGISYKDLSFINYDVQNELLNRKTVSFPNMPPRVGLSRTQSFIENVSCL